MPKSTEKCLDLVAERLWNCREAHIECSKCRIRKKCQRLYDRLPSQKLTAEDVEVYFEKFQDLLASYRRRTPCSPG